MNYIFFRIRKLYRVFIAQRESYLLLFSINFLLAILFYNFSLIVLLAMTFQIVIFRNIKLALLIVVSIIISTTISSGWIREFESGINNNDTYRGFVTEPPDHSGFYSYFILDIENLNGNIYVKSQINEEITLGSIIEVTNIVKIDITDSFENYLFTKGVFYKAELNFKPKIISQSNNIFYKSREFLIAQFNDLTPRTKNLTTGILFGAKDDLSKEEKESLQVTGVSHIISASGFNVLMIFIIFKSISKKFGKNKSEIFGLLGSVLYVLIIGPFILPALRALFMLIISNVAKQNGRKNSTFYYLISSTFLVSLLYPFYILNISFLLSFVSTFSLFFFTDKFEGFLETAPELIRENLAVTLAAIFGSAPISLLFFNSFSIIAPIANILLIPISTILMYIGLIKLIANLANFSLAIDLTNYSLELITSLFWVIVDSLSNFNVNFQIQLIAFFIFIALSLFIFVKIDRQKINEKFYRYKISNNQPTLSV